MGTSLGSLSIGAVLVIFMIIEWKRGQWSRMCMVVSFLAGMLCAGGAVAAWIEVHGSSSVQPVTHEINRLTTHNGGDNTGNGGG